MFYRVTEKPYEGSSNDYEYEKLDDAKCHVDNYYRDRNDTGNHCYITKVQYEEDVNYASPWEDTEFCRLMGMGKGELVAEHLKLLRDRKI